MLSSLQGCGGKRVLRETTILVILMKREKCAATKGPG